MDFLASWWQTLPSHLSPIAFSIGFFSIYWYGIFLLCGIFLSYQLLRWLGKKRNWVDRSYEDLFFFMLLGAGVGAKLGYIVFYAGELFLHNPLSFILPYDFSRGLWVGLPGMSYHGALIGGILTLLYYCRQRHISFWRALDSMVLLAPVITFFGRLGNFVNGELYGRITSEPWGMLFPDVVPAGALRHPSTLYEALGEGLSLFVLLLFFRKRCTVPGTLAVIYMGSYALIRFFLEFFREPDPNRGFYWGWLTFGQLLSIGMFLLTLLLWRTVRVHGILAKKEKKENSKKQ